MLEVVDARGRACGATGKTTPEGAASRSRYDNKHNEHMSRQRLDIRGRKKKGKERREERNKGKEQEGKGTRRKNREETRKASQTRQGKERKGATEKGTGKRGVRPLP